MWRQYQAGGGQGGMDVQVKDPNGNFHQAAWNLQDTAGVLVDVMQTQNVWVSRVAALDAYVGKGPLTGVQAILDPSTPSTNYDIYYGDMAIVAKDGTVFPLIGRQTSGTFTATWNTGGQPNQRAAMESATGFGASPGLDTTYFQGDHLGSARMLTAAGGWPVSSTTFYPFGVEEPGAADINHFRYASLERDAESGLDSATFRQLSSAQGRWLTPDPYDGSYDLSNPQSLNRYAYVLNNPMRFIDPSGLDYESCNTYYQTIDGVPAGTYEQCFTIYTGSGRDGGYNSGNCTPLINAIGQYEGCIANSPLHAGGDNGGGNSGRTDLGSVPSVPSVGTVPGKAYNGPPTIAQCLAQALQQNGASLSLDALGVALAASPAGPEAKVIGAVALGITATAVGAFDASTASAKGRLATLGALANIFGIQTAPLELAKEFARFGTGAGKLLTGVGVGADLATVAIDIRTCLSNQP